MNKSLAELEANGQLGGVGRIVDPARAAQDPRYRIARQAHAIWESLSTPAIPDRRQIDPIALGPALLPMLVLIDVLEGGRDYRWRLFGTLHEQEYGANLVGRHLSDLEQSNPSAHALRPLLDETLSTRAPCYYELSYLNHGHLDRYATGVMLPFTDRTEDVAVVLGAADWWRPPGR